MGCWKWEMDANAFYQFSKEMAILAHSKEDRKLALADMHMDSSHWGIDRLEHVEVHNAGAVRTDGLDSWVGNDVQLVRCPLDGRGFDKVEGCHMEDKDDSSWVEACCDRLLYFHVPTSR